MTEVIVEREGSLATVRLNRPEVRNALSPALLTQLRQEFGQLADTGEVRALLLGGSEEAFSAGADLKAGTGDGRALGEVLDEYYHPLVETLLAFPAPTISVVEGVATGAGLSLALLCDITIAASNARLSLKFSQIGLVPDTGATWVMPRRIGHARASALMLTGEELTGDQAAMIGLIAEAQPAGKLWERARGLASALSQGPTSTYLRIRESLLATSQNSLAEQLGLEAELQSEAGRTHDFKEAVAAFREKRMPRFTGK